MTVRTAHVPVRALVAAATAGALLLAGCSSSGGGKPLDAAGLKQTLLRAGDLPAQWVAKPHDTSDDKDDAGDKAFEAQLVTCIGIPKDKVDDDSDKGKVYSPDFTLGQSTVSSDAKPGDGGFGSALAAAVLTSKKTQTCLQPALRTLLAAELPAGVTITRLDAKFVKPGAGAPKHLLYEFAASIGIAAAGQRLALYINTVDIQNDRVDATVTLEGFGKPIPAAVRAAALKAVSDRVGAA